MMIITWLAHILIITKKSYFAKMLVTTFFHSHELSFVSTRQSWWYIDTRTWTTRCNIPNVDWCGLGFALICCASVNRTINPGWTRIINRVQDQQPWCEHAPRWPSQQFPPSNFLGFMRLIVPVEGIWVCNYCVLLQKDSPIIGLNN